MQSQKPQVLVKKNICGYVTIDFGLGKFHLPRSMAKELLKHLNSLFKSQELQK